MRDFRRCPVPVQPVSGNGAEYRNAAKPTPKAERLMWLGVEHHQRGSGLRQQNR